MAAAFFIINPEREENITRCRSNNLDALTEQETINEYRMTKHRIYQLCEMLKNDLTPLRNARRGYKRVNLSLVEKVLIAPENPSIRQFSKLSQR